MSAPSFTVGWVYNLEGAPPSTNAGSIIGLAAAFSSIALLAVVTRIITRWRLLKGVGTDDLAAAASTLLGIVYSGLSIYQTRWGLGLNATDFPLENGIPFSKVQYIGGPIYCLAILGFKVSLLASYLRLAGFNKTYRLVLYVVLVLVIANQIIYTFVLSFGCRPVAKTWNPTLDGTCIDTLASYFGLGGSSLGFDLLIIALPFPILRRLQLDKKKKVALGALFALGLFVTLIQTLRMRTIADLKTYTDSEAIIEWSIVEINLGVLVACVPSFAPLLRLFGRWKATTREYHYNSQGYLPHSQSQGKKLGTTSSRCRSRQKRSEEQQNAEKYSERDRQLSGRRGGTVGDEAGLGGGRGRGGRGTEDRGEQEFGDAVPMTVIHAKGNSVDDKTTEPHRSGSDGDILVVREISVSRHKY